MKKVQRIADALCNAGIAAVANYSETPDMLDDEVRIVNRPISVQVGRGYMIVNVEFEDAIESGEERTRIEDIIADVRAQM